MLHMTSGLSRSVMRWLSQVTASVGATLVATMIYAALPKSVAADGPPPPPELTSGGKFAARALPPSADDGLDTMPLPHVAPVLAPVLPALLETPPPGAALHRAGWDGAASPALPPDRSARAGKPPRAASRAEPRRVAVVPAEPTPSAANPEAGREAASSLDLVPGLMPRVLSTARAAWSFTTSAGGTLMARVVPQIP